MDGAGDGNAGGGGVRPQLIVHVDAEVLAGANRGAEIEGGGIIHGATARRLACDCRPEAWIKGRDGELQAMSVPVYLVPPALRRAVLERDHHRCTFPGCHAKAYVDIHHIVAWPVGATSVPSQKSADGSGEGWASLARTTTKAGWTPW